MNWMFVVTKAGQAMPQIYLDKIVEKKPVCMGSAAAVPGTKDMALDSFNDAPVTPDHVREIEKEFPKSNIAFSFGFSPTPVSKDDVQPHVLLTNDKKKPTVVGMFAGGKDSFVQFRHEASAHEDVYFFVNEMLLSDIKEKNEDVGGGIEALMKKLDGPVMKKTLSLAAKHASMLFLAYDGTMSLHDLANPGFRELSWGWVTDNMGLEEKDYPKPESTSEEDDLDDRLARRKARLAEKKAAAEGLKFTVTGDLGGFKQGQELTDKTQIIGYFTMMVNEGRKGGNINLTADEVFECITTTPKSDDPEEFEMNFIEVAEKKAKTKKVAANPISNEAMAAALETAEKSLTVKIKIPNNLKGNEKKKFLRLTCRIDPLPKEWHSLTEVSIPSSSKDILEQLAKLGYYRPFAAEPPKKKDGTVDKDVGPHNIQSDQPLSLISSAAQKTAMQAFLKTDTVQTDTKGWRTVIGDPSKMLASEAKVPSFSEDHGIQLDHTAGWSSSVLMQLGKNDLLALVKFAMEWRGEALSSGGEVQATKPAGERVAM